VLQLHARQTSRLLTSTRTFLHGAITVSGSLEVVLAAFRQSDAAALSPAVRPSARRGEPERPQRLDVACAR
jgi:hypothetical protein